jgi:dTDP-4-dehydrorhamnose 3,5-epimerase-like enzyme
VPELPDLSDLHQGCRFIELPVRGDERGSLIPIEEGSGAPFDIRRVYLVLGTTEGTARGFHAHHRLWQLAIPVAGACTMVLDNGALRRKVRIAEPHRGLLIPPMLWHEMEDFTPDCVLMVLADGPYDEADYIRDYGRYRQLVGGVAEVGE